MPWVRFDDQYPIHRKVAGLSDRAFRLHTEAIFWCARNLTDGHVTPADLPQICRSFAASKRSARVQVEELLCGGNWHLASYNCPSEKCLAPVPGEGWIIHDYLQYQPSAKRVRQDQKNKAARQARWLARLGRDASPDTSIDVSVTPSITPTPPRPSVGTGRNQGDPPARAHARATPNFSQQVNPGEGAAARHPSARPLPQALADAGVNGKPADGDTIARLAAAVRQSLTKPEDTP